MTRTRTMSGAGLGVVLILPAVAGCHASAPPSSNIARGRYQGIGAYAPGVLWARIAAPAAERSPGAASPADDEHVVLVVDGLTGEVRECGDYSGACVSLKPWAAPVPSGRTAPVALTEHLAEALHDQSDGGRPQP